MHTKLIDALENAGSPRILVVGDLMLDIYQWGDVERISPEAPVPVIQLDGRKAHATVGGAGSVIRDLVALGARVVAAGVVGGDAEGRAVVRTLEREGVDTRLVFTEKGRPTTRKTRVMSKSHHLLRIDSEDTRPLSPATAARLIRGVSRALRRVDAVILSDYDKGVLSADSVPRITAAARRAGRPVWADPARGRDFSIFRGATAVTPNRRETEDATGLPVAHGAVPEKAARRLLRLMDLEVAVITLDSEGMYYLPKGGRGAMIAARPRAAYDVTGAGDMVIAAAVFGVASGMPLADALEFANFAAGMEVERIGVEPIPREEMLRRLRSEAGISSEKVLHVGELKRLLVQRRRRGEKVVFTNGCFDILHAGHVRFLRFARSQGDLLVVGLNSDASVRRLKGAPRPILPQQERATIVAALESVDYVVIFEDDTPAGLIKAVAPDILVKGEDWRRKGVVGAEFVKARGGKVVLAPLVPGVSTSNIVSRIRNARSGGRQSE